MNMSLLSFFFLSMAFFTLPLHSSAASLGSAILLIVIMLLAYFISMNMTLTAIFITLVYISGILILFSYFFSLIQNSKIFFTPTIVTLVFLAGFLVSLFYFKFYEVFSRMILMEKSSNQTSFLWILSDNKLIFFFILILLLSMLFIEKVIGLKQKPLRLK